MLLKMNDNTLKTNKNPTLAYIELQMRNIPWQFYENTCRKYNFFPR